MLDDDVFLGNFDDLRPGNEIAGSENLSVDFGGRSRKIVENLGGISFVPIDGSGHDPFEENIDEFVDIVTAKIGEIS